MKWRGFGRKQPWANEGSYQIRVWNVTASDSLRDHLHILLTSSTTTNLLLILQTWNLHRQYEWQAQFWKLLAINYVIRISPAAIDNPVWHIFFWNYFFIISTTTQMAQCWSPNKQLDVLNQTLLWHLGVGHPLYQSIDHWQPLLHTVAENMPDLQAKRWS